MGTPNEAPEDRPGDDPAAAGERPSGVYQVLEGIGETPFAHNPASAETGEIALPPPEPAVAVPGGGVKKALMTSAAWTMAGWVIMQALRLISNIILTRLLFPDAFGLMGVVTVFIVGLHMFSDLGIGPAVVHSKRGDDPSFLNTAWTVQAVRGLFLWLCTWVIAWPVALFYDKPGLPSLAWMIPVVGLATAISGFNSTSLYLLDRHLAQARRVALDLANSVITMAVTITWVWLYPTVWALVGSNLIGAGLGMAFSHLFLPGPRNRFRWDRSALKEMFHFSKWIFFGTIFTFLGGQADQLVVGKLEVPGAGSGSGLELLGVYRIAVMLAAIPTTLLGTLASQLVFPLYNRVLHGGRGLREAFCKVHPAPSGFAAFIVTGLIAAGPTFIAIAYDWRYQEAGWMIQVLAVGAWFQMLEITDDALLWALGRAHVTAYSNAFKVVAILVLVPVGYWLGGIEGLIIGFVGSDLVRYGWSMLYLRRQGLPTLRYDVSFSVLIGVVSVACLFAGRAVAPPRFLPESAPSLAAAGPAVAAPAAPGTGFPATMPWGDLAVVHKKDWPRLWLRFGTEVGAVVLLWAIIFAVGWSRGMFRLSWDKGPSPAEEASP
jgi:O-antigen/teichoic acid export membrane protein